MTFDLRRITAADVSVFDRIADGVFDEPIDPPRLARYLRESGHLMILAVDGDVVVGQCAAVVHRHPDKVTELYVDELGTADGYRRQGIARALMNAMFEWGRELGCEEAWLGTETDNVEANGLYRSLGVEPVLMNYYEFEL
ncbi:MAG: GNAT family N-acetyltransferase [Acidimicrobiia bacterium]